MRGAAGCGLIRNEASMRCWTHSTPHFALATSTLMALAADCDSHQLKSVGWGVGTGRRQRSASYIVLRTPYSQVLRPPVEISTTCNDLDPSRQYKSKKYEVRS